jgi:hypothetical protein
MCEARWRRRIVENAFAPVTPAGCSKQKFLAAYALSPNPLAETIGTPARLTSSQSAPFAADPALALCFRKGPKFGIEAHQAWQPGISGIQATNVVLDFLPKSEISPLQHQSGVILSASGRPW